MTTCKNYTTCITTLHNCQIGLCISPTGKKIMESTFSYMQIVQLSMVAKEVIEEKFGKIRTLGINRLRIYMDMYLYG